MAPAASKITTKQTSHEAKQPLILAENERTEASNSKRAKGNGSVTGSTPSQHHPR